MKAMTVLGFDFGMKRIGVAVGQTITRTANPLDILPAKDGIPNWDQIGELIKKWRPDGLIVGVPLTMDGGTMHTTFAARKFANRLHEKFKLPVHHVDERLTTKTARENIFSRGGYKALQRAEVDSEAAKLMVEDWLRQNHEA